MTTAKAMWWAALAVALTACSDFRRGPIVTYDGGCGHVTGAPCNPYVQTGCTGGDICVLHTTTTTVSARCIAPGTGRLGARCSGDTCLDGLACLDGQCRSLCCPDDPTACGPTEFPTGANCDLDFGLGSSGLLACSVHCSWTAQNCANGGTCIPFNSSGSVSDCSAPGPGVNGASCDHPSDCAAGFICISETVGNVCRHVCDPTTPTACPLHCLPLAQSPATFGACVP